MAPGGAPQRGVVGGDEGDRGLPAGVG